MTCGAGNQPLLERVGHVDRLGAGRARERTREKRYGDKK
jgi:hypothetical protein